MACRSASRVSTRILAVDRPPAARPGPGPCRGMAVATDLRAGPAGRPERVQAVLQPGVMVLVRAPAGRSRSARHPRPSEGIDAGPHRVQGDGPERLPGAIFCPAAQDHIRGQDHMALVQALGRLFQSWPRRSPGSSPACRPGLGILDQGAGHAHAPAGHRKGQGRPCRS